jgi:hypothetical protein
MPYDAWHRSELAVHHLRTFGCVVYSKVTRPHLAKFNDRGCVFISYEEGSKAYRVYDQLEGRMHVSRDTIIKKNTFWN